MTENGTKKTNPQIINKLQSTDPIVVMETIKQLRSSGNAVYLPILIDLLHSSGNPEIKSKIFNLLADLKNNDAIPHLINAIQDKKYAEERKVLVSVCWENGLDYSAYLTMFVDLVIAEKFDIAFEAYTVITTMEGKISSELLNSETDKIESVLNQAEEQKRQLLIDIIEYLPQISG